MTYDLLIAGEFDVARLRAALAVIAAVAEADVDVQPDGVVDRRWEAPVLCTYHLVPGNVTATLDIYLRDQEPPELEVATRLAAEAGLHVLVQSQPLPPGSYWLIEPDGSRTRATVEEYFEADETRVVIEAVAKPVSGLPPIPVAAQPEVIRFHRMPTPITDELRGTGELLPALVSALGGWEAFVARMTTGWPPDGWYPRDYFDDDLAVRDQLAALPDRFAPALDRIDQVYRAATSELADSAGEQRWWRRRVPDPLPWS
ncbi:hypothetical protein [Actinoplanes rectilineatus]|uniref:hypothetical protein n=1 Tax=Actinoplanes rectilineatus TaxID=113571 RepID=UPI00069854F6|nr:hypothetical protein [Actinoplanes rectilineatus]